MAIDNVMLGVLNAYFRAAAEAVCQSPEPAQCAPDLR